MCPVEMRKFFAFFIIGILCVTGDAGAANVTVKKASSVKKQETSGLETITSGSLLPGVIGLVSNVASLKKQTEELKAECVPSGTESAWVDNIVKEYAKTGAKTAEQMLGGAKACSSDSGWDIEVQEARASGQEPCMPVFNDADDADAIWSGYPRVKTAKYCPDLGDTTCADSKKKNESNIYKIFGALDWTQEDYLVGEGDMFIKMMEKTDKCAPEKITARNREAYANFVKQTISGAGQSQNTGAIYEAIGNLTGSGGGLSGVGSLAPTVIQLLDK